MSIPPPLYFLALEDDTSHGERVFLGVLSPHIDLDDSIAAALDTFHPLVLESLSPEDDRASDILRAVLTAIFLRTPDTDHLTVTFLHSVTTPSLIPRLKALAIRADLPRNETTDSTTSSVLSV